MLIHLAQVSPYLLHLHSQGFQHGNFSLTFFFFSRSPNVVREKVVFRIFYYIHICVQIFIFFPQQSCL